MAHTRNTASKAVHQLRSGRQVDCSGTVATASSSDSSSSKRKAASEIHKAGRGRAAKRIVHFPPDNAVREFGGAADYGDGEHEGSDGDDDNDDDDDNNDGNSSEDLDVQQDEEDQNLDEYYPNKTAKKRDARKVHGTGGASHLQHQTRDRAAEASSTAAKVVCVPCSNAHAKCAASIVPGQPCQRCAKMRLSCVVDASHRRSRRATGTTTAAQHAAQDDELCPSSLVSLASGYHSEELGPAMRPVTEDNIQQQQHFFSSSSSSNSAFSSSSSSPLSVLAQSPVIDSFFPKHQQHLPSPGVFPINNSAAFKDETKNTSSSSTDIKPPALATLPASRHASTHTVVASRVSAQPPQASSSSSTNKPCRRSPTFLPEGRGSVLNPPVAAAAAAAAAAATTDAVPLIPPQQQYITLPPIWQLGQGGAYIGRYDAPWAVSRPPLPPPPIVSNTHPTTTTATAAAAAAAMPTRGTPAYRYSAAKILLLLQYGQRAQLLALGGTHIAPDTVAQLSHAVDDARRRAIALWHEVHYPQRYRHHRSGGGGGGGGGADEQEGMYDAGGLVLLEGLGR